MTFSDDDIKGLIRKQANLPRMAILGIVRTQGQCGTDRFNRLYNEATNGTLVPNDPPLAQQLVTGFQRAFDPAFLVNNMRGKGLTSYDTLATVLGITVLELLAQLRLAQDGGYNIYHDGNGNVELRDQVEKSAAIDVRQFNAKHHLYGVTGDNHLGSRYSRLDVLNALFDIWQEQGVTTVFQCGNIIDGEARFNRHDLLVTGIKGQVDYLIDNWPHRLGMTTEFVTGDDHEGWYVQREGIDIGRHIEAEAIRAGRSDLVYLGHMEKYLELKQGQGSALMSIMHAGGGTAYAISYTDQKIVESYQGGEKPNLLLVGHYHKFNHGYPREVNTIQVGCTEDQTPFMRKKKIQAHVGGVTLRFDQDDQGILHNVNVAWHPFYDRSFYAGTNWKYHWSQR